MSKKTVVVTGASSGIGYATAVEFAKRGYQVIAGARRLESMEELRKHGIKTIKLDVTSDADVEDLKQLITKEYQGKLLYLYNNAGQGFLSAGIEIEVEKAKKIFDVNYFGAVRVTTALSPFLIATKGAVGFTGSAGFLVPIPFLSVYASSKAALHTYADTLAVELRPFGVKVLDFISGGVHTGMQSQEVLPPDSIYRVKGFETHDKKFNEIMSSSPVTAEQFAKQVVTDFEKSKIGKVVYLRGSGAQFLNFVNGWVPYFAEVKLLTSMFKLGEVFSTIEAKQAGRKSS